MAAHSIHRTQKIPVTLAEAWDFFANPSNLTEITPAGMGFKVISLHHGSKMYAGQIIEYTVRPIFGIPVYWMTEITQVKHQDYFIDEQRFGPYKLWHHQHHFKEVEGGVEMTDIIHYRIPFGIMGRWADKLLVRKKLEDIFAFRYSEVVKKFGVF